MKVFELMAQLEKLSEENKNKVICYDDAEWGEQEICSFEIQKDTLLLVNYAGVPDASS